jgi:hypothetical protein
MMKETSSMSTMEVEASPMTTMEEVVVITANEEDEMVVPESGKSPPVPDVAVANPTTANKSRIFRQFRRLGFVSNRVPCVIRYIHSRRQNFIVTCNGKAFNTYVVSI